MVAIEQFWTGIACATCHAPLVSNDDDVLRQHVLDDTSGHEHLLKWAIDIPENLKRLERR